eukprot:8878689-Alexandrium_andersonii.AAC.1
MPAHASSVTRRPPRCSRGSGGDAAALMVSASLATRPARSGSAAARTQSQATWPMASTSQHLSAAVS